MSFIANGLDNDSTGKSGPSETSDGSAVYVPGDEFFQNNESGKTGHGYV